MPKILVTSISFLFLTSILSSTTYALVATPFIAIGLVKLMGLMITTLTVPVTFVIHLYRKKNLATNFLLAIAILLVLGAITGAILHLTGFKIR